MSHTMQSNEEVAVHFELLKTRVNAQLETKIGKEPELDEVNLDVFVPRQDKKNCNTEAKKLINAELKYLKEPQLNNMELIDMNLFTKNQFNSGDKTQTPTQIQESLNVEFKSFMYESDLLVEFACHYQSLLFKERFNDL